MNPQAPFPELTAVVTTSYEGRWFFPGDVPAAVEEAFLDRIPGPGQRGSGEPVESTPVGEGGGGSGSEAEGGRRESWPPARTDRYLNFAPDMGIKLRDEPGQPPRLEFKGRLRFHGPVALASGVVTLASAWSKWSYPADPVPAALRRAFEPGGGWVALEKSRLLRRFRLDPGEPPRAVPLEERLARGVQLELTRLRVTGPGAGPNPRLAWTLGFEGFPLSGELPAAVHAALAGPLASLAGTGLALDEAHSASYPEWLLSAMTPQEGRDPAPR